MRFLHTADWQIGMRAVQAGAAAHKVREARIEAARAVTNLASRSGVEFMLLSGDTFESNAVDRDLVGEVSRILSSSRCPVFVLPGNHDPLVPGSVWDHPSWAAAANVTLLKKREPVPVPGGILLACPLFARRSKEDPTQWIVAQPSHQIRVVAAHGNVGEKMSEQGGYPIAPDTAARTGADYVALGHWHSTRFYGNRMAYPGTPEPSRFGEQNSGNALIVDIPSAGAIPNIAVEKTSALRWLQIGTGTPVTAPGKLAEITRAIAEIPDQGLTLIDVVLSGLLFERDQDELGRIEKACERFLHHRIDRANLHPAPDDEDWVRQLPAGPVRATAARLRDKASGTGVEAQIATQALLELYTIAGQSAK